MHHVNGFRCRGTGFPPIEFSEELIRSEILRLLRLDRDIWAEYRAHVDARRNEEYPRARLMAAGEASRQARTLERRLKRRHKERGEEYDSLWAFLAVRREVREAA